MAYAVDTSVPVERSRAEIESILSKYGASRFAYMIHEAEAVIGFQAHGKFVKFTLPLPNPADEAFTQKKFYRMGVHQRTAPRSPDAARKEWEQACRSRWRSLTLCIRAKLEAVQCGITTFEAEFLAHFVMPGGQTVGQKLIPQLDEMARAGKMPTLLLE